MKSSEWICKSVDHDQTHGGEQIEQFVAAQKEDADSTDKIYHCTSSDTALKILESCQFWMTSLPKLNDSEELKRVEIPEYTNRVFVACFTKKAKPDDEFWDEYGGRLNGVTFRFRKEWVTDRFFLIDDNLEVMRIPINDPSKTLHSLINLKEEDENNSLVFCAKPDFCTVKYGDLTIDQFVPLPQEGKYLHLDAIGLIKPRSGISTRTGKYRVWENEKEVRYKTTLDSLVYGTEINYQHIAVELSEEAFSEFEFTYSPEFPEEKKQEFERELMKIKPKMKIIRY